MIFQSGSSSQLGGKVSFGVLCAVCGRSDTSDVVSDLPETDEVEDEVEDDEAPLLAFCGVCESRKEEVEVKNRNRAGCGRWNRANRVRRRRWLANTEVKTLEF